MTSPQQHKLFRFLPLKSFRDNNKKNIKIDIVSRVNISQSLVLVNFETGQRGEREREKKKSGCQQNAKATRKSNRLWLTISSFLFFCFFKDNLLLFLLRTSSSSISSFIGRFSFFSFLPHRVRLRGVTLWPARTGVALIKQEKKKKRCAAHCQFSSANLNKEGGYIAGVKESLIVQQMISARDRGPKSFSERWK